MTTKKKKKKAPVLTRRKGYILFNSAMAEWVKAARLKAGLHQRQSAGEMGLTQALISALERGAPTFVNKKYWTVITKFYASKGVPPLAETPVLNQEKLVEQLQIMKKNTSTSWVQIAEMLGVSPSTLDNLIAKRNALSSDMIAKIQAGLKNLHELPKQLTAAGVIDPPKAANKPKVKVKKSIIENTAEIPTELALAMEKLKAISILEKYVPTHGNFMNGGARKLLQG